MDFEAWRDRELERRIREEADDRVERLAPPEAFPHDYTAETGAERGERGPNASAVNAVLAPGCCGWKKPPEAQELYDAMRSDNPTERHQAPPSGRKRVKEAHIDDIVMAKLQGAFTLAAAGDDVVQTS